MFSKSVSGEVLSSQNRRNSEKKRGAPLSCSTRHTCRLPFTVLNRFEKTCFCLEFFRCLEYSKTSETTGGQIFGKKSNKRKCVDWENHQAKAPQHHVQMPVPPARHKQHPLLYVSCLVQYSIQRKNNSTLNHSIRKASRVKKKKKKTSCSAPKGVCLQ